MLSWFPYLVVGTHFSGANGASAGVRMGGVLKIYGTVVLFAILFGSAPGESCSAGERLLNCPKYWPQKVATSFILVNLAAIIGSYDLRPFWTKPGDSFRIDECGSPSPARAFASVMTA